MDIAGIVDHELLYTLELQHPVTEQPLGITFKIRSAESDASRDVLRKHTDRLLERRVQQKPVTGAQLERNELEKAASYIAAWEWGANTYAGKVPVLSMEQAVAILEKEGWIFVQVVKAAEKIGNFSPA